MVHRLYLTYIRKCDGFFPAILQSWFSVNQANPSWVISAKVAVWTGECSLSSCSAATQDSCLCRSAGKDQQVDRVHPRKLTWNPNICVFMCFPGLSPFWSGYFSSGSILVRGVNSKNETLKNWEESPYSFEFKTKIFLVIWLNPCFLFRSGSDWEISPWSTSGVMHSVNSPASLPLKTPCTTVTFLTTKTRRSDIALHAQRSMETRCLKGFPNTSYQMIDWEFRFFSPNHLSILNKTCIPNFCKFHSTPPKQKA